VLGVALHHQVEQVPLIAMSFIKGVAAAFTIPAGLSIATTTFTAEATVRKQRSDRYGNGWRMTAEPRRDERSGVAVVTWSRI
jgi:hypothetical protein